MGTRTGRWFQLSKEGWLWRVLVLGFHVCVPLPVSLKRALCGGWEKSPTALLIWNDGRREIVGLTLGHRVNLYRRRNPPYGNIVFGEGELLGDLAPEALVEWARFRRTSRLAAFRCGPEFAYEEIAS